MIEKVDFKGLFSSPRHPYSAGLLSCIPKILETRPALDSMTRGLILQQLKRLQSQNRTAILLISHDLNVVRHSCNDVIVMYCGRLLEKWVFNGLFSSQGHHSVAGWRPRIPKILETRLPLASITRVLILHHFKRPQSQTLTSIFLISLDLTLFVTTVTDV